MRARHCNQLVNYLQLTASGEAGGPVGSVLGAVEEAKNISPGAVTPLLRPMVGSIAEGKIPSTNPATLRHAVFQVDICYNN